MKRKAIGWLILIGAVVGGRAIAQVCPCDCDGNGTVAVSELVASVNVTIGLAETAVCEAADGDGSGSVEINELVRCVNAALDGCESILGGPAPGLRRFSLDPQRSEFIAVLPGFGSFPASGFTGFMDLRARRIFQSTTFFLDIMDASEYFAVQTQAGATCVRPVREALPVLTAGVLYCAAGGNVDLAIEQERTAGFLDTCDDDGLACTADADCATGGCFLARDCEDLGGTIDLSTGSAICVGPIVGDALEAPSTAGAALIVPDPAGRVVGFPVEIISEAALPCGDEPTAVGFSASLALTTGVASSRLSNVNAVDGEVLESSVTGEPFDCERWTGENGAGVLVLSVPAIALETTAGQTDLITDWVWVD